MSLPIISINETDREKIEISRDIGKSCERYGFFIIKDHNLKISTIENARNLSKEFFSLSLKNKMKYHQLFVLSFCVVRKKKARIDNTHDSIVYEVDSFLLHGLYEKEGSRQGVL